METTAAGLRCVECGERVAEGDRCPACGGALDPVYDGPFGEGDAPEQWRYADRLPFDPEVAVTLGEGGTPLVDCPSLADELDVERVLIKDDGRNPTGSARDRAASVAVTAATQSGAEDVALASTGDDAQAVAAYAARAGIASHAFVPSRAGFVRKAMVNVHGGDMRVVGGRYPDAEAALEDALADEEWYPAGAFRRPYAHEGLKTALYEVCDELSGAPDAFVVPTGDGAGVHAAGKAGRELVEAGRVDRAPRLYAAQASGCAPVVEAFEAGAETVDPWETPDTICGDIEIPDPAGGTAALRALRESDGGAVATDDDEILESAAVVASDEGLEVSVAAGAAASGAWALAEDGAFDADDTVVLWNTGAGSKDGDVLRSHLMGQGI